MNRFGILFIICISSGLVVFIQDQINTENNHVKVEKSLSTINKQDRHHLELKKRPFDPTLIEFYTGKIMKAKTDIADSVYVSGVQGHSMEQVLTIFSKDRDFETKISKVKIDGDTLMVFLEDEKSKVINEELLVFQTKTSKMPVKYEVIRGGEIVKSEELFYAIE